MDCLTFLLLIATGVQAWGDSQCFGDDVCEDHTVLDFSEDDMMVSLLQRRAFLERPPVDVDDGMLVAVHSVTALRELKMGETEHKQLAAEASTERGQLASVAARENSTGDSNAPVSKPVPEQNLLSEKLLTATAAAPVDRHLSLVETRSDPTLDVVKNTIAGIQHDKSDAAHGVQMAPSGNRSSLNDTDNNSTAKLNLNMGGAPNDVEEKLQAAENVSRVEMKTLATLIVEAIILFVAETFRRIWFMGAVEASTDARLAVLSFPFVFWALRWSCGSSKRGTPHAESAFNPAAAVLEEGDRQATKPQAAEMKEPARCVFETVGCALERTGHQGCGETVAFRYLALNASGLAYAALGRPTKSGRWRIEMLDTFWPSSKQGEADPVDLLPLLESILLGVVHEQDVNTASDELGGHWAFVSADRGRGFAYSPAGRAVRRGVETPCAAVADPRKDVIELVLDTPRRAFEVFCVRDSSRELICSFEGIRAGRYLLAVSLRTGSIKVAEISPTSGFDESSS